ncbi:MAG: FkbM family methyltransferase [Eubacteriales bacterium]
MLKNITDIWTALRSSPLPVVMYGTGDGADKILDACALKGVEVRDVFVSPDFARGQRFRGYEVTTLERLEDKYPELLIITAFAFNTPDMLDVFDGLCSRHTVLVPDVPVVGQGLFDRDYALLHAEEFGRVYNMLADDTSRRIYENIIRFKLTGDPSLLPFISTPKDEAYALLSLRTDEVYVDAGAYTGDTVCEVYGAAGGLGGLVALEPDVHSFGRLCGTVSALGIKSPILYNGGAWDSLGWLPFSSGDGRGSRVSEHGGEIRVNSIDNLLRGGYASLIKLDVEGAELRALEGCKKTIRRHSPTLILSLYHRNEDLFAIPLKLAEMSCCYEYHIRRHPSVPAWDINLYAIPLK